MGKFKFLFVAFMLLFACTPENNMPNGSGETANSGDNTAHVAGISLNCSSATIEEGEQILLVATITPETANSKVVFWSSSSANVALVDDSGKVTGVNAGSSTITATVEDSDLQATCLIRVEPNHDPSITVNANHISAISAVLIGKANLGTTTAEDLRVGFQYSTSAGILPSNSTIVDAVDSDSNYNYTTVITDLSPDTVYYFRSFILQNGQYTYGKTKEFKTRDVVSLLESRDASGVEAARAMLNAKLDLTDVQYTNLVYGFLWGTSETKVENDIKCPEIINDGFSAILTRLSHKTQYWYKAYAKLDSQTFYGELKTFTTEVVPVTGVSLSESQLVFNTIGRTKTLYAMVDPYEATNKLVNWSSDNEEVATVSEGKVKAIGNGSATITATTVDQGKTATCDITVAQWITGISLDKTSLKLVIGNETSIAVTSVLPETANDKTVSWSSSDSSIATVDNDGRVKAKACGQVTIKATANDGSGVFAACSVWVKEPYRLEAVDLGLSVKWANANLGANTEEAYGDYYAWGETSPKSEYSWSTYKFGNSEKGPFSKYNTSSSYGTVDKKIVLEPEDDAAHVLLGGKWRMPTIEEWKELWERCTWTWVDDYYGTGVKGMLVTRNGNSIFLPAIDNLYKERYGDPDFAGYYWSSSLFNYPDSAYVWAIYSASSNMWETGVDVVWRFDGLFVRPISE